MFRSFLRTGSLAAVVLVDPHATSMGRGGMVLTVEPGFYFVAYLLEELLASDCARFVDPAQLELRFAASSRPPCPQHKESYV